MIQQQALAQSMSSNFNTEASSACIPCHNQAMPLLLRQGFESLNTVAAPLPAAFFMPAQEIHFLVGCCQEYKTLLGNTGSRLLTVRSTRHVARVTFRKINRCQS